MMLIKCCAYHRVQNCKIFFEGSTKHWICWKSLVSCHNMLYWWTSAKCLLARLSGLWKFTNCSVLHRFAFCCVGTWQPLQRHGSVLCWNFSVQMDWSNLNAKHVISTFINAYAYVENASLCVCAQVRMRGTLVSIEIMWSETSTLDCNVPFYFYSACRISIWIGEAIKSDEKFIWFVTALIEINILLCISLFFFWNGILNWHKRCFPLHIKWIGKQFCVQVYLYAQRFQRAQASSMLTHFGPLQIVRNVCVYVCVFVLNPL